MLPRSRTRALGSEPAILTASAAVTAASDATGVCGEDSARNFTPGQNSTRSSLPEWTEVRLATPCTRTLAPIRLAIEGWFSVQEIRTRTRRPSTTMCVVMALNRSTVTASAIPSTSMNSQSTLPWSHSPEEVRLAAGSSDGPSSLTPGRTSVMPLGARRVSPQTSTRCLSGGSGAFTLSNLMAPVRS